MRTFVSTDGCSFIFPNVESGYMGTTTVPTLDAVLEFAAFINEEREAIERGPQVVRDYEEATLLVNGGSFRVERDPEVPRGYMWIRDAERRLFEIKLREGRAERCPALLGASGGADAAGDAVASKKS